MVGQERRAEETVHKDICAIPLQEVTMPVAKLANLSATLVAFPAFLGIVSRRSECS